MIIRFTELLQAAATNNYNRFTNSLTLQFTIAHTQSSICSLGIAWHQLQQLCRSLSFHVPQLQSLLAGTCLILTLHSHKSLDIVCLQAVPAHHWIVLTACRLAANHLLQLNFEPRFIVSGQGCRKLLCCPPLYCEDQHGG